MERFTKDLVLKFEATEDKLRSIIATVEIRPQNNITTLCVTLIDGDKKKEVKCNTLQLALDIYNQFGI